MLICSSCKSMEIDHFFEELGFWNQRETLIRRLEMDTLGHFFLQMQHLVVGKLSRGQCSWKSANPIEKILKLKVETVHSLF